MIKILTVLLFALEGTAEAQNTNVEVQVGLVTDSTSYPQSSSVLQKAIAEVSDLTPNFTLSMESTSVRGCTASNDLQIGSGAYGLCDLYERNNISVVFGPTCFKDLEIAARLTSQWNILEFNFWTDHPVDAQRDNNVMQLATQSSINIASNLRAAFTAFNWEKISVFVCTACFSDPDLGVQRTTAVLDFLKSMGTTILSSSTFGPNDSQDTLTTMINATRHSARIFFPIAGSSLTAYQPFLTAISTLNLPSYDYTTVVYLVNYEVTGLTMPWKTNTALKPLYNNMIIVYNDFFNNTVASSMRKRYGLTTTDATEFTLYVQLYEAAYLYADLIDRANKASDGKALMTSTLNQRVIGPLGEYAIDSVGRRLSPYRVVMVVPQLDDPYDIVTITLADSTCSGSACIRLVGTMNADPANISIELPLDMPVCGFTGELCEQTSTVLVIIGIVGFLCIATVVFFVYKRLKGNEIRDMPWSLTSDMLAYIDLTKATERDLASLHSLQQTTAMTEDMIKATQEFLNNNAAGTGEIHNVDTTGQKKDVRNKNAAEKEDDKDKPIKVPPRCLMATVNNAYCIVYKYPYVEKRTNFVREEINMFYKMKQIVHDNINTFVGVAYDSQYMELAWTHCFKGTLEQVLRAQKNEESNSMAHNFRGAFARDILKGLEFLHQSDVKYHGALTMTTCLVDAHWILKLSSFGIEPLVHRWRYRRVIATEDKSMQIQNSELHYYAPEIRRQLKEAFSSARSDLPEFSVEQLQFADVWSFGMILYEILFERKFVEIEDDTPSNVEGGSNDEGENDDAPSTVNCLFNSKVEEKIPSKMDIDKSAEVHDDLCNTIEKCWNHTPNLRPPLLLIRRITEATLKASNNSLVDQMISNVESYTSGLEATVKERTSQLEEEQKRSDDLLFELLPPQVAQELKSGRTVDAKSTKHASILYSDIVGFTSLCSESEPMEVVALLSGIFQAFDKIISLHSAYKVETIGDAYMITSGVPEASKDHVRNVAAVALMNRQFLQDFEIPHRPGQYLHCRWGLNSGEVFTGVVGFNAPRFFVFGNTVTVAAKMESSGVPDRIQMTLKSHQLLTARYPEFKCSPRGQVKLDGIGTLLTYFLDGVEELLMSDRSSYKRRLTAVGEVLGKSPEEVLPSHHDDSVPLNHPARVPLPPLRSPTVFSETVATIAEDAKRTTRVVSRQGFPPGTVRAPLGGPGPSGGAGPSGGNHVSFAVDRSDIREDSGE